MNSLLILFSLLALAFADNDVKCPCKVDDNYFLRGEFYGSIRPGLNGTGFNSLVGVYEEAIFYDEKTPTNSMMMTNSTVVITDGTTGRTIVAGWTWTLGTKEGIYTMSSLGNDAKHCLKHRSELIPRMSEMVGTLYRIYPPSKPVGIMVGPTTGPPKGIPTGPPTWPSTGTIICQGPLDVEGVIITLGFAPMGGNGKVPRMTFSTWIKGTTCITMDLIEIRPLENNDATIFKNPCPHTKPTNQKVKLHLNLHERLEELLFFSYV